MKHNLILKIAAKLLIPLIILFALYVQFHGDFGPGGGFQAGVIFSAAFILYTLVFGLDAAQIVLGHASADVTQVYAECDQAKGAEVAQAIG